MKLHLESNIAEGTPEELVEYLRLVEGNSSDNQLFSFGHAHQPDEDTLKSLVGSLVKVADSYTGATEAEQYVEEDSMHDVGAFYTVTEEASEPLLPVGVILKHQQGNLFIDSKGQQCIIARPSFVKKVDSGGDVSRKDRFELAKQLGIQLTSTTDLAVEAKGKYFKVTEKYSYFDVGDLVTIDEDEGDNMPQCKDEQGNTIYIYLHHLELVEEVEEVEPASTGLQVGDKVRVLESACGAVGEATVTTILEDGEVELAGTSKCGIYLSNWSSHVTLLEKIEEVEDKLMGYTFWYLEGTNFNNFVVLKATNSYFEDSKGFRYTHKAVNGHIKPLDRENASKYFERSKDRGYLLKYYPTADVFTD